MCIKLVKNKREKSKLNDIVDTIKTANLVKIDTTAKNKKIPDPRVVIAPEIIEIPIS